MTSNSVNAGWTTPGTLQNARKNVRDLLLAVPSFGQLSVDERSELAGNMVKVLSYIENPNGILPDKPATPTVPARGGATARQPAAAGPSLARAQADAVETTKQSLAKSPGAVGRDFVAGAVREGVEQFGALVQKVDFPKFVGGLIKNVFQAIVESSIEQMRAYAELISNVAKTVDQFMGDNISPGAGRDWLAERYPDLFEVDVRSTDSGFEEGAPEQPPQAALVTKGEDVDRKMTDVCTQLGVNPPITDISDPNAELKIVTAARLQMAKSRQQLLSSMVMLGISRIVVTDGSINAKVVFDMRAEDKAKRKYTASMHDVESFRAKETMNANYGSWFSPVNVSAGFESEQSHVATVGSAVDETSESKAEVKAKLSGEVRVNFKSDYLPLEKMATPEMMSVIQGNSTPYDPNSKPTAPGGGR